MLDPKRIFVALLALILEPVVSITVQCHDCVAVDGKNCQSGRCVGPYCYKAISQGLIRKGCEYVQFQAGCHERNVFVQFDSVSGYLLCLPEQLLQRIRDFKIIYIISDYKTFYGFDSDAKLFLLVLYFAFCCGRIDTKRLCMHLLNDNDNHKCSYKSFL